MQLLPAMFRQPGHRTRVARVVLVTAATLAFAFAEACYLTSDFSGVADGVRPTVPEAGDEAASPVDASAPETGADGAFSCDQHTVCTTFDNGALASLGWKIETKGSGTATLDTTEFVSPPASFRSIIPTNTTPGVLWEGIIFQNVLVPTTYTTLTYAFDFRLAQCTSKGGLTVVALNPTPKNIFGLLVIPNGLEFGESAPLADGGNVFAATPLSKQPTANQWTRLTLRIQNPANPTVDVLFDQTTVLSAHPLTPFTPTTTVSLNLGNNGPGTNGQCDIAFDNVTFDRE